MKGNAQIIQLLNEVLTGELTAINQYFLHSKMQKDWGYLKLAEKSYQESIEEMKHADELTERVLFLEGMPNLQKLNPLKIGETVTEQLQNDLELEMGALSLLRKGIKLCFDEGDHTSKALLEKILEDEEDHVDWIETQLHLVKKVGEERYLAEKL